MNILLVDDHAIVRQGYRSLISLMLPDVSVFEASNGKESCGILLAKTIDIMVLDINLREESGLVLIRQFLGIQPDMKVIFFSMFEDGAILHRAMQSGAMGYISKNNDPEVLISAINVVAKGQEYIEKSLAVKLANQLLNENIDIEAKLTRREFEIFMAIAMKKDRHRIADELNVSVKTVSNSLTVIKRKLNAGIAEFTQLASHHGYMGSA